MKKKLKKSWLLVLAGLIVFTVLLPLMVHSDGKPINTSVSSRQNHKQYFAMLAPRVKEVSAFYGVKPSIILGQMALASDYGDTLAAHRYHNFLGLEAVSGQNFVDMTQPVYSNGVVTSLVAKRMAVYPDWETGLVDYLERLRRGDYGKDVYETMATSKSFKEIAESIQKSSFTEETDYSQKLFKVIEDNQLTDYDK